MGSLKAGAPHVQVQLTGAVCALHSSTSIIALTDYGYKDTNTLFTTDPVPGEAPADGYLGGLVFLYRVFPFDPELSTLM